MSAELDPMVPRQASEWQDCAQGVYIGLPAETYHKASGVSHSMLRHMDPPARLPAYLTQPRKVTEEMILGTLTHAMILEPEKPLPKIVVQPETYPAPPDCSAVKTKKAAPGDPLPWHNGATYCKRWHAEAHEAGLIVLTAERMESLRGMVRSVSTHPGARELLANCETEVSVFHEWTDGGVLRKGRMDIVPRGNVLADVKTCEDASTEAFARLLADGYGTQAAYYLDLWNDAMPQDQKEGFVFIAVERNPPYLVKCHIVGQRTIEHSRRVNRDRLIAYSHCVSTQSWPGFSDGFETTEMPKWAFVEEL